MTNASSAQVPRNGDTWQQIKRTRLRWLQRMSIPEGFPARLSDDQLTATLDEWITGYSRLYGDVSPQLPELKLALINAGLQEQARRETAERPRHPRRRQHPRTVLAIAIVTLVATVVLTFVD